MTVGAAGGLNVIFKTLLNPEDEVIAFSPYFLEYNAYVTNYDGILVEVPCDTPAFLPSIEKLSKAVTERTKAVIINNPNNPTGVVYPVEVIKKIAEVLEKKEKEFGTDIYLVSDEPYRELVYDNAEVPYLTKYYANTIVGYSYSKSLSLPGERIGYLVIPNEADDYENLWNAAVIANRILGFVNAPSLQQLAVAKCLEESTDVSVYDTNRKLLYHKLQDLGFECAKPEGAFYMWVKAMEPDDKAFADKAKDYNLLLVPGSAFMCPGYVRIAYCVDKEMLERSFAAFEKLARAYQK